jgi:8-oxo-dGTP pyrophosphatase MutT (NUDIX family)
MANTGLNFADNPYDEERYERIIALVHQYYGEALEATEPPEAAAVREAREETGLDVEPQSLVGAYRREPIPDYPSHTVALPYLCAGTGGELELSHEGEALRYRDVDAVPEWFPMHEEMAVEARQQWAEG